mmetsp:Transcript_29528/g.59357  ORF Transcript_29528/g.59357 Transcript_29528/m.59357 type:complete len:498 (-) Transcript_29528:120-1613(-)
MMKSIYTTVAAVLIASLLTAEAWSTSSPTSVVNRINQNHVIVAPHDVNAAHLTRSTTKLSATAANKNTSLSRSTLVSKLANNLHLNLIRSLIAKLTTFLTHKSKLVILSTMLTIATFFPQSAVAAKSSLFSLGGGGSTKDSAVISTGSNNDGGGVMKVGKFVVTVGAIGAGASTANKVMRNKFTCNDDDDESAGGDTDGSVMNKSVVSKNEESPNGTTNGSVVQSSSAQKQPSAENKKTEEANNKTEEIEPLSEEWIQQQLNDAEKRSNVLNDAIKMTQQSSAPVAPVVSTKSVAKVTTKSPTKVNGNKNSSSSKKKVSVGNTIGIPPTKTTTTTTTPLVKNLDSKIEMLQRRDAERSIQQQRINDEQAQVEIEKKKVALVEAERKIELAEMEYKKSQQQQEVKQVVEEKKEEAVIINSAPITTTTPQSTTTTSPPPVPAQPSPAQATTPPIKVGPGGSPAKSKEEDLELTAQVILEYVKTMDSKSSGVVDDDSDDE